MGLLDGKVAIVTGAGGGIGRCHALLLAQEGAKVVVNDLGSALDGSGASVSMAQQVVDEIAAQGGEAVANGDSVATREGAEGILQAALDAFGRADILVNNAGILRDKTLLKLEEANFDLVVQVHLKGTFLCTQAFARHVKERADQGDPGGRVINTSSYAGLKGNYGQTNYAGAKAGIYGMTLTWAQELTKLGVTVNCLAPMAKTRMTDTIDMVPDSMRPEQVAPMALFLASELGKDVNGRVFGIHGQQLLEYRMLMTDGATKDGDALWTPQEIAARLKEIAGEARPAAAAAAAPAGPGAVIATAFRLMPQVFVPERAKGWNAVIHFDITDGTPYTVKVEGGACSTQEGKHGSATCVVTVDQQTYADVVQGKQKPEQAFMAGKIKASNLGDMMKFGSAFDMKKAKQLAEQHQAAPAAVAAPQPLGPAQVIGAAFRLMPQVFVPERAKGWNAVIHFDITDGTPYTVSVKDGACSTQEGKHGDATCVVTVDQQTYADVVQGKQKPEQAFMAGKIKASNLGDMMKFGSAFDMKQAKQLAEQHQAAPAAAAAAAPSASAGELVERAFAVLPETFRPEKASGWSAVVQFHLAGGEDWTVTVADGRASASRGRQGTATCVVAASLEDYAQILSGELKAEQAFVEGRVKPSNVGELMKFGSAFDLKRVAQELRQPAAEATSGGGLNRDLLGHVRAARSPEWVRPEHALAFARATQDENPAYAGEGAVAPPMFSVRLFKDVLFDLVSDPDLGADVLRLVHGEQDMEFLRPLRPWDLCALRVEVKAMERKSSGEVLRLEERLYAGGELAVRVGASMFIRGEGGGKKGAKAPAPAEAPRPAPVFEEQITVAPDQSLVYADASLDNNPIHTDAEVAKLAGFPGVILQGLCTMSFAAKTLVDRLGEGDPTRLARLAVRFSKPVLMGDVLTVSAWKLDATEAREVYGVAIVNQDGVEVIQNGRAELRV